MTYDAKKKSYNRQYSKEHYKRIPLEVTKEHYETIKKHANENDEKINTFIKNAINLRIGQPLKMEPLGFEYWQSLTEAENNIYTRMDEFSKFFDDMTFKKDSCAYNLISAKCKSQDEDEWSGEWSELPDDIEYFSYEYFKVKVDDLEKNVHGRFDPRTQTLTIDTQSAHDNSVLLHEMIHLHEYVIQEHPVLHDAIIWGVYTSLREQIPTLDEIITAKLHVLIANEINSLGGIHSLLFLLKSFDLDCKMGYPLGTVYGYGLADDIAHFIKQD